MKIKNGEKGFTIIELLIVVAIIGILATLMLVSYSHTLKKSRDARRVSDIESIKLACNMYADKNGTYPTGCGWDNSNYNQSGKWNVLDDKLKDYIDLNSIQDPIESSSAPYKKYMYVEDGTHGCRLYYRPDIGGGWNIVYCKD